MTQLLKRCLMLLPLSSSPFLPAAAEAAPVLEGNGAAVQASLTGSWRSLDAAGEVLLVLLEQFALPR